MAVGQHLQTISGQATTAREAIESRWENWLAKHAKLARSFLDALGGGQRRLSAQERAWSQRVLSEDMKMLNALERGGADGVRRLVEAGAVVRPSSMALQKAAQNGDVACLRALAEAFEKGAKDDRAFFFAAMRGNIECLEELLPISHLGAVGGSAMAMAARAGHAACVFKLARAMGKDPNARSIVSLAAEEARGRGMHGLATDMEAMGVAIADEIEVVSAIDGSLRCPAEKSKARRL